MESLEERDIVEVSEPTTGMKEGLEENLRIDGGYIHLHISARWKEKDLGEIEVNGLAH